MRLFLLVALVFLVNVSECFMDVAGGLRMAFKRECILDMDDDIKMEFKREFGSLVYPKTKWVFMNDLGTAENIHVGNSVVCVLFDGPIWKMQFVKGVKITSPDFGEIWADLRPEFQTDVDGMYCYKTDEFIRSIKGCCFDFMSDEFGCENVELDELHLVAEK